MNTLEKRKKLLNRFLITVLIALAFVAVINEGSHLILKENTYRAPKTIELGIPTGTAERVDCRVQHGIGLGKECVFVYRHLHRRDDAHTLNDDVAARVHVPANRHLHNDAIRHEELLH